MGDSAVPERRGHAMRVAVGSTNPVKIRATEKAFSRAFPGLEVIAFGIEVESGVPPQPLGEETIRGAMNRAAKALEKSGADFGVGIEAGLFPFPNTLTGYLELQWCAVRDRAGRASLGCGPGFEQPPAIIEEVIRGGRDVEEAIHIVFGIKGIGRREGAIGLLSKGLMDREELTESAVLMALIPILNEGLYFKRRSL
ncbi:MAG: inosine/xanthosine triphosphatase [Candidatus Bathyarchaeia archaeon]